ncbi:uracil-DNA glycosylase [Candidatus Riesia pediculicola]|uniref:Uracil-DNA glycosylase n=1 Tax=Riesia pediculicola (strain USDA) TaxID=515618 RepID=D4G8B4_RIEPU|nr:uracil-DNA glycosylase [Candidatus Riesia pediculicola]ADD79836.1 uracil-DNA glycosylase [Candidatus Riesia pediculicola USDA]ARC53808.1 uracil-DNA glycosylase [Candidatus Riesia pediculicola]
MKNKRKKIEFSWKKFILEESKKKYFLNILHQLNEARKSGKEVYPKDEDIFNAFYYTEFHKIKLVILGQDPYHCPNQSHGLCFSVPPKIEIPPSLRNIYKELEENVKSFKIPNHGCLTRWTKQGIFLLNSILTVERGKPLSHKNIGWQIFTNKAISKISLLKEGVIFLLWGNFAKSKKNLINRNKHYVLESTHPSPFSANFGFFGCKHFLKANQILKKNNIKLIDWSLPLDFTFF